MTGYAIEELVGIFRLLKQQRWSAILIGGQAVNLYANHYADRIIDIESYRPLASRDLDFHGGPVDARRAMSILNADGKINDGTDPSPNAGVLRVPMQTGDTLIIDILTSVFGVSASELVRSSKTWNLLGQVEMEVIHPLLLLESKLACLRGLPQQGRQDRKHVQLMSQVMHAWLAEHLDSPREVYRAIERIAAMMMTPDGVYAWHQQIDLWQSVPLALMREQDRYQPFFEQRLEQLKSQIDQKRE